MADGEGFFHRDDDEEVERLLLKEGRTLEVILRRLGHTGTRLDQVNKHLDQIETDLNTVLHPPPRPKGFTLATSLLDDASQQVNYTLVIDDKAGQVAQQVGPDSWTIDNTTAFTLTPAADGLSGSVAMTGPQPGGTTATVTVSIPTSTDGSTPPLVETDTITVVAGGPASATLTGSVTPATPAPGPATP